VKTGGLDILYRHIEVGGQNSKKEQNQTNAGRRSGFSPKKPKAEQNFENSAEIDNLPMEGHVRRHNPDIGIGRDKMQDACDNHDQRKGASGKSP